VWKEIIEPRSLKIVYLVAGGVLEERASGPRVFQLLSSDPENSKNTFSNVRVLFLLPFWLMRFWWCRVYFRHPILKQAFDRRLIGCDVVDCSKKLDRRQRGGHMPI
jgi:hypothetical protein